MSTEPQKKAVKDHESFIKLLVTKRDAIREEIEELEQVRIDLLEEIDTEREKIREERKSLDDERSLMRLKRKEMDEDIERFNGLREVLRDKEKEIKKREEKVFIDIETETKRIDEQKESLRLTREEVTKKWKKLKSEQLTLQTEKNIYDRKKKDLDKELGVISHIRNKLSEEERAITAKKKEASRIFSRAKSLLTEAENKLKEAAHRREQLNEYKLELDEEAVHIGKLSNKVNVLIEQHKLHGRI